jgi:hypothetical protein
VGPPQYPSRCSSDQGPWRRFRPRRCLLKGCEQWFRPSHPQRRYCSEACQQAARRWRRWHAGQRYRASAQGKERRCAQSRRYRERRRQQTVAQLTPARVEPQREGQRPAYNLADFIRRPCHRPGCYTLFPLQARSPAQHFCSCSCRKALRRVLDREAHWRRRHRRPRPGRYQGSRLPGNSS